MKAAHIKKAVQSSTPRRKTFNYTHTTYVVLKCKHSERFVAEGHVLRMVWLHVPTALTNAKYLSNFRKLADSSTHTIEPLLIPPSSVIFSPGKLSLPNKSKGYSTLLLPYSCHVPNSYLTLYVNLRDDYAFALHKKDTLLLQQLRFSPAMRDSLTINSYGFDLYCHSDSVMINYILERDLSQMDQTSDIRPLDAVSSCTRY